MQIVCVRSASTGGGEEVGEWAEQSSRSALSLFKEKEEEIERKKVEVRDKVFSMLGRVEEETKRLAFIRQELELMADPTRREVDAIRKRIDKVNRQLKPLGKTCLKKVRHYKTLEHSTSVSPFGCFHFDRMAIERSQAGSNTYCLLIVCLSPNMCVCRRRSTRCASRPTTRRTTRKPRWSIGCWRSVQFFCNPRAL